MANIMFYLTTEVMIDNEGNKGVLPFTFDTYEAALAKYYTVLSAAASSTVPYHACFIIRSDGVMTDGKVFDRTGGVYPQPQPVTKSTPVIEIKSETKSEPELELKKEEVKEELKEEVEVKEELEEVTETEEENLKKD